MLDAVNARNRMPVAVIINKRSDNAICAFTGRAIICYTHSAKHAIRTRPGGVPFILAYSICPSIACLCHVFINSRRAPSFPVGHFRVVSRLAEEFQNFRVYRDPRTQINRALYVFPCSIDRSPKVSWRLQRCRHQVDISRGQLNQVSIPEITDCRTAPPCCFQQNIVCRPVKTSVAVGPLTARRVSVVDQNNSTATGATTGAAHFANRSAHAGQWRDDCAQCWQLQRPARSKNAGPRPSASLAIRALFPLISNKLFKLGTLDSNELADANSGKLVRI